MRDESRPRCPCCGRPLPLPKRPYAERFAEYFAARVDPVPVPAPYAWLEKPCQRWTGTIDKDGYGRFHLDGNRMGASRASLILSTGEVAPTLWVNHRCDRRWCVEPTHLYYGTAAQNSAEMVARGRQANGDRQGLRRTPERAPRGTRNFNAKLNDALVREIRAAHAAGTRTGVLAARYGINRTGVQKVVRRESWAHVE
jgi:hypothetical protein